ncbi:amphiregulin [Tiliqua scincoides]|uniref:amphiregulin n=1 Tax=Tiliqua scincoides TaxID=71010 RepID=UPI0034627FCA
MPRRHTLSALLLLLPPLLWAPVCQYAAGSGLNVTEQEQNMPISRTLNTPRAEMSSSGGDSEEDNVKELMVPQVLLGDLKRVVPQVKKSAKPESGKNSKKRGNKGKKNKNKNQTPCEKEYKNFCVHGECVYHKHLKSTSCKCHPDYFGERCAERFLKSQKNVTADRSSPVVVVWTVVPLVLGLAVIVIVVIVQVREKCPKYGEKEERKKLRQENGSSNIDA